MDEVTYWKEMGKLALISLIPAICFLGSMLLANFVFVDNVGLGGLYLIWGLTFGGVAIATGLTVHRIWKIWS